MQDFQPRYIMDAELASYGLPTATALPTIMTLVDAASSLVDETCGRIDGTGAGSLVYSTYVERVLPPQNKNIVRVSYTPLVAIDTTVRDALSGQMTDVDNNWYTGFIPNQYTAFPSIGSVLTPLISASGRYGYGRNSGRNLYPDLNYGVNPLMLASFFGGPPQWTVIDVSMVDVDVRTGECWFPAGIYLSQYSEILVTYNSGYDPNHMPRAIKHATAALVKNFISRGGGTTGMKSYSVGKVSAQFTEELVDLTVSQMLQPYKKVVAM